MEKAKKAVCGGVWLLQGNLPLGTGRLEAAEWWELGWLTCKVTTKWDWALGFLRGSIQRQF